MYDLEAGIKACRWVRAKGLEAYLLWNASTVVCTKSKKSVSRYQWCGCFGLCYEWVVPKMKNDNNIGVFSDVGPTNFPRVAYNNCHRAKSTQNITNAFPTRRTGGKNGVLWLHSRLHHRKNAYKKSRTRPPFSGTKHTQKYEKRSTAGFLRSFFSQG